MHAVQNNMSESHKKEVQAKAGVMDAPQNTNGSGASNPPVDVAAQIDENNTDLTARIANAIKLTNSVAGITPGADPALGVMQLESLFPLPGSVISSTQAMGTSAPMATAPFSARIAPTAPLQPLPGQEQSILSLFSNNSNFLTASEMAVPLNDPSLFLPTPFAPGQNANTLQQHTLQQQQVTTPHNFASIAPISGVFPLAAIPSVVVPPVPLNPAAVAATPQQLLFQQLAAAYAMGGQQPMFAPSAVGVSSIPPALMNGLLQQHNLMGGAGPAMAGGLIPPSLMNGLLQPNNPMSGAVLNLLATGLPASLNPGIAGLPASLNPGIAGLPASLNPGIAGLPASLNPGIAGLSGMGPLANVGNLANPNIVGSLTTQPPVTSSSIAPSTLNQVTSINNAMAPLPQQSANIQEQIDRMNAQSANVQEQIDRMHAASSADVNLLGNPAFPEQNPSSLKQQIAPSAGGSEVIIKSREARWVIRFNELLEFRREHGHCRVPHGYTANRKLSWWVMNQRAQFAHRKEGKKTWLGDDRIALLNDLGFIWSPHLKRTGAGGGKKKEKSESSGTSGRKKNYKSESSGASSGGKKRENPESSEAGEEHEIKGKRKGGDSKADGKKKKK